MSRLRRMERALILLTLAGGLTLAPPALRGEDSRGPLLAEDIANRHGVARAWWRQVDIDPGRDWIESLTLAGDTLYVQTRLGMINALDSETGRVRWTQQAGSSELVSTPVGANNDLAAVVNGSKLYLFTHDDGKLVMERKLQNVPSAAPVMAGKHVLVPLLSGVVEGIPIQKTKGTPWAYSCSGQIAVQPYATAESVCWTTDSGLLYVVSIDPLKPRFRHVEMQQRDPIVAQPGYKFPYFYVGSLDGHVYKIHETKKRTGVYGSDEGVTAWRYTVGAPVDERPLVIDDRLYVSSRGAGLCCVVADSPSTGVDAPGKGAVAAEGSELWRVPSVVRLLAASKTRLYGLDRQGRLTVLRREDGAYLDTLSTPGMEITVPNDITDRVYLATRSGTVQCLHELGVDKPIKHRADMKALPETKGPQPKGSSTATPKAEAKKAPAGDDVFGGAKKAEKPDAAAGDVFGGDDGAAKKAPAKKKEAAGGAAKKKAADDDAFAPAPADKKAKDDGAFGEKKPKADDPFGGPKKDQPKKAADPFGG